MNLVIFNRNGTTDIMKKRMQALLYSLWGLVTLIFGLGTYKEIYEPGMGFWSSTLTIISATFMTLVALLALSWALLSMERIRNKLLPHPKYKFVNNYTVPCLLILLVSISNTLGSSASAIQGKELGFLSEAEFSDAKRNKIFDTNEYSKYLVEKEEKDKADEEKRVVVKAEEDRAAAVESAMRLFDAEKREQVKHLISKDLTEHPELTQQILNEIAAYDKLSVERTSAERKYIDDGVSYKLYMKAIDDSNCRQEMKSNLAPYKAFFDAQSKNWRPFAEYPDYMVNQEMYQRDLANVEYLRNKTKVENIFGECIFPLIKSIPHLSRPDAKPLYRDPYAYYPAALKCTDQNGGDYNMCYKWKGV